MNDEIEASFGIIISFCFWFSMLGVQMFAEF